MEMERTKLIDYKGKRVFTIDFSNLKSLEEIRKVTQDAQKYIHAQPPMSVITLTSVEETHFNNEIRDMFTEYIRSNKPYVKASAIIGVSGLKQIIYNSLLKITGRDTRSFSTFEQAIAWLGTIK